MHGVYEVSEQGNVVTSYSKFGLNVKCKYEFRNPHDDCPGRCLYGATATGASTAVAAEGATLGV